MFKAILACSSRVILSVNEGFSCACRGLRGFGRVSFVVSVSLLSTLNYADSTEQLPELTVTAQKYEESLQDVPASVTVFSGDKIEDQGLDSLSDIANFTPNFINFDSGIVGLWVPSMRGIHEDGSGNSPIGLFVDGVPILSPTGFNDELLDIERVEILRGPQGTLYGSNTEAGVINIITAQPSNNFSTKLSAEAGEDNKRKFIGTVKGPINENLLYFSLSGSHYEKDGYIKNTNTGNLVNNREYDYGKANLLWTPTDTLDISLTGSFLRHDDGDQTIALSADGAEAFFLDTPAPRTVDSDLEGWNRSRYNTQALNVKWQINSNLQLQSITTHRKYKTQYLVDFDFSPFPIFHKEFDNTYEKYSTELKLSWLSQKNKLVGGIYYDDDDNNFRDIDDVSGLTEQDHTTTANTLGIFLHAEHQVTDKINVISGVRYDRKYSDFNNNLNDFSIDETWVETSPKLGIEYLVKNDLMMYASVSKGYRSGGFNDHAAPGDPLTYSEEKLISYEIGTKSQFLDRKVTWNSAFYYMDINDMQVRVNSGAGPEFNYTDNAAKAWSAGFESELEAKLSSKLSLFSTLGINRVEFDDYEDSDGNYDGNKNPYAPEYTYSISLNYRNEVGLFGNVALLGNGSMYLNKENRYERDAYNIVNAKIGYEIDNIDMYLYADNLFDEEYNAEGYFGGFYTVYSPPREVGVKLTVWY